MCWKQWVPPATSMYDKVTKTFPEIETVAADSTYKKPHICKKVK